MNLAGNIMQSSFKTLQLIVNNIAVYTCTCIHGNYIGHESGSSHSYMPVYSTEQHSQFIAIYWIYAVCLGTFAFQLIVSSFLLIYRNTELLLILFLV